MLMRNRLLLVLAFGLVLLGACYNKYEQEMIVVNKILRGVYVGEEMPSGKLYDFGWHEIGLSRNGKEPIEYIWHTKGGFYSSTITNADVGEEGTIYLHVWARRQSIKLPRPNAKKPPTIGLRNEALWTAKEITH
jgi:hypothetical protein